MMGGCGLGVQYADNAQNVKAGSTNFLIHPMNAGGALGMQW